ncbi:MAG: hypothetical protein Q8T09_03095 [Candidatus Melainabacteria bacterium]|nr:hypothetical protein [Candidatus Melainabacteria bacterium]
MANLRRNIAWATLMVLIVAGLYMEFPALISLILVFAIVIYLTFQDWKSPSANLGRLKNSANRKLSNFSQNFSMPHSTNTARAKGRRKNSNRVALLTGLSAFGLTVEGPKNWRYPFLRQRAYGIAKTTLIEHEIFASNKEQWLTDSNTASLKVAIFVEEFQGEIRLTVQIEVVGKVTITRSSASISEAASLWKNTVTRLTSRTELTYDLEDSVIAAFNALLRDYFGSTHGSQRSHFLPPGS